MTIAILSWKSPNTLINTLESYKKYELDLMDDERIIFFQEISDLDRRIAKAYGYQAHGIPVNIGIAAAYKSLVELATGDLFLFLENDWELIEPPRDVLYDAADRLRNHALDVCRLRHTRNPGEPLWSRQYMGQEMVVPEYLLDCCYWQPHPEDFWPIEKQEEWYITTSPFATWTNNPTFFRTQWLRDVIAPKMGQTDIEVDIQSWWKSQQFNVGQHETGLFTHKRLDR
jgi:hypothetical protein